MKEIQRLNQTHNEEIVEMNQFAFQYELSEQERTDEINFESDDQIWGWITEGQLAAKVHIVPLATYINGKQFEMGGISAVATWPEYRRQGMVKKLLYHSLQEMKKQGQIVSFLAPFSFPFYRKHGWDLLFTNKTYHLPISYLKQDWQAQGYLRRVKKSEIDVLDGIYQAYAKNFTGMLARSKKWWEETVLTKAGQIAVAYSETDEPIGYLMYKVKDNTFTVIDYAYTSLNSQKLILEFISHHDASAKHVNLTVPENDNLTLLLGHAYFEQKLKHHYMGRIVDVEAFLQQFPFDNYQDLAPISIAVDDSFFPENSGTYELSSSMTRVEMKKYKREKADVHASIQMLTMMFLGYKRPIELFKLDLIQGEFEAIERLDALIPVQQTQIALADYF